MAQLKDLLVAGPSRFIGDVYADQISAKNAFSDWLPSITNTYSLGSENLKWKNLYAQNGYLSNALSVDGNVNVGGQLSPNGGLYWISNGALPEATSLSYFLGIDAFASGGRTKWISAANACTSIVGTPTVTIGAGTASNAPTVSVQIGSNTGTSGQITKATTGLYGVTKLTNSYTSTDESLATTGKALLAAIQTLDVSAINGSTSKTLVSISETDGKISATYSDISITKSQISDFPTSLTPTSHTHGNITNDGKIGSTADYAVYTTTGGALTAGSLAVSDPSSTSGSTTTFVSKVTQNSKGQISVEKKTLDTSGTWSGNATKDGDGNVIKDTYVKKSGDTMTGRLTAAKGFVNLLIGTGIAGKDNGSSDTSTRYQPAKWIFDAGVTVADGDMFTVKIPVAGHDYGVYISVNNGIDYYPVVLNGTGRLTTHYPVSNYITVVFESAGSAASVFPSNGGMSRITASNGAFRVINYYDSNSNYGYTLRTIYSNIKAGSNKIFPYTLIMQNKDGRWESIVTSASNGTGKAKNTHGFMFNEIWLMYANATYNENNNVGTYNVYTRYTDVFDGRYSFNVTTSSGFTGYKPVYLVGTIGSDGLFYLADSWWSQTLPTTDDGKIYIYLGDAYDSYRMVLHEVNTAYVFRDNRIQPYDARGIKTITRSGTTFTATRDDGSTFTFTQQDNNSVTGVKGNAESSYRTGNVNITATNIGLGNVENTALSTWAGSSNITTIGTLSSGTVPWARLGDIPSSFTPSSHTHGNITNDGKITTAITIANGDYLIVGDTSDGGKLGKGPAFVSTTAKKFLKDTGAWAQVDWGDLTGKPSTFTPASHTHGNITNAGELSTASMAVVTDGNKKITVADLTVSSATAETTTATTFVYSVTQSAQGQITVKTRPLPTYNNYSLPLAANGTRGGIQIGYSSSGKNYAVQLSSEKAYVNVPWTDTKVNYSLNTTAKAYLMASTTTPTGTAAAVESIGDTGVYLTATTGELSSLRYSWHDTSATPVEKAYTTWNATDESIDFIFV